MFSSFVQMLRRADAKKRYDLYYNSISFYIKSQPDYTFLILDFRQQVT